MKEYFGLQLRMAGRRLRDNGFNPVLAYALLTALFILLSCYLFDKTTDASYIYLLVALLLTGKLSEERRNEWLRYCFKKPDYRRLRITENILAVFPFLLFLGIRGFFLPALLLGLLAVLLALVSFRTTLHFTLPTPFDKRPFEFSVGFRNTFFLFPVACLLTVISIIAGNFNLGAFSLLMVFLIVMTYFTTPDPDYYVWVYSLSPGRFLWVKMKMALGFSSVLVLPVVTALGICFFSEVRLLLLFLLLGYAYLAGMVLGKYASYPDRLSLPKSILFGLCFAFPPGLLILIPVFYKQSVSRLKILSGND